MNPMQQYAEKPETMPAPEAMAMSFSLKRVGAKPLSFHGSELAMVMNFSPTAPSWYEIAIYRTTEQRFVAVVKLFYSSSEEQDVARAWEFDDFGAVVTHLEAYDPADDVRVDVQPDDPSLSLPEMAAHALALRARAAEARRQYRALLGEILHELEAA
jgi:hypothetical protein